MRNRRFPKYPDDADYTTNSPSYYDDIARKQKLIQLLTEKIWEYDKELAERFEAWDKNLEEFPEEVKRLLIEWMEDGTLDHIINETIFNWKADKTYVDSEVERLDQKDEDLTTYVDSEVERLDQKDEDLTTYVDSEVGRLDLKDENIIEQLDQNIQRTKSIFDIKTLGIVGDGSLDETELLQEIVDYSRNENIKVINNDKNLVINISKPIYFDGSENIDFGFATINKTTNTKGEGTNISPNRIGTNGNYIIDEYTVDAHFIFRHDDYQYTSNIKTFNFHLGTTAVNTHDFAIFAPRINRWQIENVTADNYRFDKFIFTYSMWHIPKFNNIEYHGGEYLLEIANDGSDKGSSTSINANQLYNQSGKGLLKLYAVAYSTFTNIFGDINTDIPFVFNTCQGVTVNSPEIEIIDNGKFAWVINSSITFNSPSVHVLKGVDKGEAFLWFIESGSNVVINAAKFPDYTEGVAGSNIRFNVDYASHVTLNQCKLPKNMSAYRGLSGGSTLTTIDENGVSVQTAEGTGMKFDGRKIIHGTGMPTTGTWNIGDMLLLEGFGGGYPLGYFCTKSGEFGVTEDPVFEELPTTPIGYRKQRFGDKEPSDGYWRKGDMVVNTNPGYGGVFAWICVNEGLSPTEAVFEAVRLT